MPDFKKIVAANWKMKLNPAQSLELADAVAARFQDFSEREVVICPDFLTLSLVGEKIKKTGLKLGAQDMFWEDRGSFTGEISPVDLKELGCQYVILGHSERRSYLKEEYSVINKKVKAALKNGLTPIMCVGEKEEEKKNGQRDQSLKEQIRQGVSELELGSEQRLVLAYEPIWAIGSGQAIEDSDIQGAYSAIRSALKEVLSEEINDKVFTIYGGSVDSNNVDRFSQAREIEGLLVGGASLKSEEFFQIAENMLK